MRSNYRKIGEHIRLIDERNKGLRVKQLLGLSISKQFIPSVANIVGTDMENYKIIQRNQFACSTMQVRRDKKMPVALLQDIEEAIISQAYPVFEVKDEDKLLPEYLMMWFTREEFDREACFHAVGGVRGSLEWEDFCDLQLPIPSIEKQREIVAEYKTIQNRIKLNEQLIQKLEETAQGIYKQWFVEFEFPNEEGKPYKSSGGEMVWCEELGKEIPRGWEMKNLNDISDIKTGPFGSALLNEQYITGGTPVITVEHIKDFRIANLNYPSVTKEDAKRLRGYSLLEGDIIFSRVGSVDLSALVKPENEGWLFSSRILRLRPDKSKMHPILISNFLKLPETRKLIISLSVGSTMPSINTEILAAIPICCLPCDVGQRTYKTFIKIDTSVSVYYQENQKLSELKALLLSKLATVE